MRIGRQSLFRTQESRNSMSWDVPDDNWNSTSFTRANGEKRKPQLTFKAEGREPKSVNPTQGKVCVSSNSIILSTLSTKPHKYWQLSNLSIAYSANGINADSTKLPSAFIFILLSSWEGTQSRIQVHSLQFIFECRKDAKLIMSNGITQENS